MAHVHAPCLAACAQGAAAITSTFCTQMQQTKCCPIQSLLFSMEHLYCKGIHLLPPTANLPLQLYVVLMINKNNSIWVNHRGGFIHLFSLSICNQNKRCSPKAYSQALSASFLQETAHQQGGINISIQGVHFNTVTICQILRNQ